MCLPIISTFPISHLTTDPELTKAEVSCSISGDVFHCSTERNENFIRKWTSIFSNDEALVWWTVNPLSKLNAIVECSDVIGHSWSSGAKMNEL